MQFVSELSIPKQIMIRLGGPAPPNVDPEAENRKANEAVLGNVALFGLIVGLIRVSPMMLEYIGVSTQ